MKKMFEKLLTSACGGHIIFMPEANNAVTEQVLRLIYTGKPAEKPGEIQRQY